MATSKIPNELNKQLTTSGLAATGCKITSGGYCQTGKMVIVNLRFNITSSGASISGFPGYSGSARVVGVCKVGNSIVMTFIGSSGLLDLSGIAVQNDILFSTSYICD